MKIMLIVQIFSMMDNPHILMRAEQLVSWKEILKSSCHILQEKDVII